MTDTTVIGLGQMGMALARQLLTRGHSVTAWNRSSAKAGALEAATIARTARDAVAASTVVIVCVTDYAATREVLEGATLAGRTIVQLTTGTPKQARELASWVESRGANYVDGAILSVPTQIGTPESLILVAGNTATYEATTPLLSAMAATVIHTGADPGSASALDFGFLSFLFGALHGFYHAAALTEAEGITIQTLSGMLESALPAIAGMVKHDAERIAAKDYANPQSSLGICWMSMRLLEQHAREANINSAFPSYAANAFKLGVDAGHKNHGPAALVEVLRNTRS